jgi:anti-sigma factor RsiW
MDCEDVRLHLHDDQRGHVGPELHRELRAHLERCPACAHEEAAEHVLTEVLERRLPQHPASLALKRRLLAQWPAAPVEARPWWRGWRGALVPALAAALVLALGPPLYRGLTPGARGDAAAMVAEAVNDHVRVLQRDRPLDVESGGIHEVKPWFAGRLDFAPVVSFEGDAEFPLQGGAVGYFVDRKAAVFVYKRRLHPVSLFVFRAEGLPWPARGLTQIGGTAAYTSVSRGFNVILWRAGDLGYALVSDVDALELGRLAAKLARG